MRQNKTTTTSWSPPLESQHSPSRRAIPPRSNVWNSCGRRPFSDSIRLQEYPHTSLSLSSWPDSDPSDDDSWDSFPPMRIAGDDCYRRRLLQTMIPADDDCCRPSSTPPEGMVLLVYLLGIGAKEASCIDAPSSSLLALGSQPRIRPDFSLTSIWNFAGIVSRLSRRQSAQ